MRYVYIVIYSFKWYCMVRFWFLAEVFSFDPYFLDSISRYRIACPILPYPITSPLCLHIMSISFPICMKLYECILYIAISCNMSLSKMVGLYTNTHDALMMYWGELYDFTNLQGPEVAHRHDDAWCISTLFCTQMIVHRTSRIIRRK